MKPIVKYQGGKSKELPLIKTLLPSNFRRVVEPFCGGAAVALGLEYPAVLNDFNRLVINLYRVVADPTLYPTLQHAVRELKTLDHDVLEVRYYAARDIINDPTITDPYTLALAYIIVRQLCFSGMERYNAKGQFNVPFGHYGKFACNLHPDHHHFFQTRCDIRHGSFADIFSDLTADDFLFLDPPYLERLGYTNGDGGLLLHEELATLVKDTPAQWMIVHSDHPFYRDTYSNYSIHTQDFLYGQRFGKGKNHSGAKVQHLYITNYTPNI